jgi:hypothetical protein
VLTFGAAVAVDEDLPRHTLRDLEVVVGWRNFSVKWLQVVELGVLFDCHLG